MVLAAGTDAGGPVIVAASAPAQGGGYQAALDYHRRGIAVVPQLPGAKHPCVRWKRYQDVRPTSEELEAMFGPRPGSGVVAVLGPVSNLFAIDVDGPEAHAALAARLGGVPLAPTVLSGSGAPCRYHLHFLHPEGVRTRARITPWHPKLEFRSKGGVLVLPPSLHKSGRAYAWAPGRSPDDVPLGPPPAAVVAELVRHAEEDARKAVRTASGSCGAERALRAARAYLAALPPSVEG